MDPDSQTRYFVSNFHIYRSMRIETQFMGPSVDGKIELIHKYIYNNGLDSLDSFE